MAETEVNPGWKLSSVHLNGINYIPWSLAVTQSLAGKRKLGFINGKTPCPASTDAKYEEWVSSDQLVRSWLLNSMEAQVAEIFTFSESAKELWDATNDLYGNDQSNAARIFELKAEIASANQGDKMFIEHLGNLKKMWEELDMFRPHTTDAKTLVQRAGEDKVFSLLNSLHPKYEHLRSNILMNATLPSLSSVCATIQREETWRKTMNSDSKPVSEKSGAQLVDDMRNLGVEKGGKIGPSLM